MVKIGGFRQQILDFSKISTMFHPNVAPELPRRPDRRYKDILLGTRSWTHDITMYSLEKSKHAWPANDRLTVVNPFWPTELISGPFPPHEGLIWAPETQSNHFQPSKTKVRDKIPRQSKISESKTAREYVFLRSRRDSVDENSSKNGPRGRDND